MEARPWEFVNPIDETTVPNMITIKTSQRTPTVAGVGRKEDRSCRVMACNWVFRTRKRRL
jgi:hypothetical protein